PSGSGPYSRSCIGRQLCAKGRNRYRDNLYVLPAVLGKAASRGHAEWSVAKRRVPTRATARTALSFWTEPIRREQPAITSAPTLLVSTCSGLVPPVKRP